MIPISKAESVRNMTQAGKSLGSGILTFALSQKLLKRKPVPEPLSSFLKSEKEPFYSIPLPSFMSVLQPTST